MKIQLITKHKFVWFKEILFEWEKPFSGSINNLFLHSSRKKNIYELYVQKYITFCALIWASEAAEGLGNGVKPSNVLGGAEQHASFSFVRPGLTQTSFAFNGPSSHQAFSSSIGNPHLAQKVYPNVAHALSYRNPGLGILQLFLRSICKSMNTFQISFI